MSGHSKWSKIKHAKGAADAKKGKIFSKLSEQITIAVKEGGGDINNNPSLRLLVDKAKSEALPSSNIERAINRGMGVGKDGVVFEECVYEGIGPAGVSFVLDVTTDNKNRVVADLRRLFSDFGGNLAEGGSLLWNFEQKGRIEVRCGKMEKGEKYGEGEKFVSVDCEEVMMALMDIEGIVDIEEVEDDLLFVFTDPKDLDSVKKRIEPLGYVIDSYKLVRVAKVLKEMDDSEKSKVGNFIEKLEEYSDIQGVWFDADTISGI
jgi:YebC/PmpR family DNA-binding regulatory protein